MTYHASALTTEQPPAFTIWHFTAFSLFQLTLSNMCFLAETIIKMTEHKALLWLLNPYIKKFDVWICTFHMEAFEFMMILCSL